MNETADSPYVVDYSRTFTFAAAPEQVWAVLERFESLAAGWRWLRELRIDGAIDDLYPCFYGGGGSCAFDRAKFLELGGFDRLLEPFYLEDTDLGFMAAGARDYLEPLGRSGLKAKSKVIY